jgi:phospholipid transport system substrate-binding protein
MENSMVLKRLTHRVLSLAAVMLLGCAFVQGNAQASISAPDELIKRISTEVLGTIQKDKTLQDGDIDKLIKLVDERVMPNVNFTRMTASAVGRGWREASVEQKNQLTQEFKLLLIRTYAGAFSQAKDVKMQFIPLRAAPDDSEVIVRTRVVPPRGEAIQLDYRLERTPQGWKIYDVNVLGVWLVENYRNSFAQEINKSGVDGLIRTLRQKNIDLAKG